MIVMGTRSGQKSSGNLVGGNTGATLAGKFSAAAVTIKLDFPVPRSPATTIRTPVRFPEFVAPAEALAIRPSRKRKTADSDKQLNDQLKNPSPTLLDAEKTEENEKLKPQLIQIAAMDSIKKAFQRFIFRPRKIKDSKMDFSFPLPTSSQQPTPSIRCKNFKIE